MWNVWVTSTTITSSSTTSAETEVSTTEGRNLVVVEDRLSLDSLTVRFKEEHESKRCGMSAWWTKKDWGENLNPATLLVPVDDVVGL